MRKEKYIQLPPIPEELDGNVVRMIWKYTKLPEKEQQFVYEQYKVLSDDSNSESDVDAVLIKPDHPENIEEFGNNMKAVLNYRTVFLLWTCCRFYLRLRVQYIERST